MGGSSAGESTCVEGVNCDTYTLTVSGTAGDWAGKVVDVRISWLVPANDAAGVEPGDPKAELGWYCALPKKGMVAGWRGGSGAATVGGSAETSGTTSVGCWVGTRGASVDGWAGA